MRTKSCGPSNGSGRRSVVFVVKWRTGRETNAGQATDGVRESLVAADACLACYSPGPRATEAERVSRMATDAIVFACVDPVPGVLPDDARVAGTRTVATDRSDFPNQVDDSLAFPGGGAESSTSARVPSRRRSLWLPLVRGVRDRRDKLPEDRIVPRMDDPHVVAGVAFAGAIRQGIVAGPAAPEGVRSRIAHALCSAR